ncbi:type II toxin-antitoxin system VapB family antitoxin [Gordonia pseudamarae]|jgi:Arc/MetJ family transcription regulator|uniref:Type II toxin-antitoxin system VapB family antitoxin n=1 Tax=Gordonia pseudamarae TaxID=2831662 RepID=A0ABX6IJN2_9ACTN|nr:MULTISPECIES: type II toxin-antitoxin system VapB family antitoxin [Gordonia]MBD0024031.1 type II toxin-antitoxin system VapB family antitoxin [Gordonia sp. (in: high G+C Gram-positive bacteria)]QHN26663.1 type II toxin-antitoxin system VapB family antitoxin [Gordonia pseudamarae]QHN35556.1 type II toxin-antitoxin system VapB family antitoxin [Gordonia pseudamarae]
MTRTNIDLDDDLVAEVIKRFNVSTKKEAVDLALRRLVGVPLTTQFLHELRGIGWKGDLDELRAAEDPWKGR